MNLHHRLDREAAAIESARRNEPIVGRRLALSRSFATLPPNERATWARSLDVYRERYASHFRDLLFDPELDRINTVLATVADDGEPRGLPEAVENALIGGAGVYRRHFWPEADSRNRAWISALRPLVAAYGAPFRERLPRIYQTPWPDLPFVVDVARDAYRFGAYTQRESRFVHTVMESGDPRLAGFAALEMVFHEASHAIVDQDTGTVGGTILRAAERAGHAEPDQFWHAVIFYSAGAVAVETLRASGHGYAMYADANGLFADAWPAYRAPLVAHWQPFLDGRGDFHTALERCVTTLV